MSYFLLQLDDAVLSYFLLQVDDAMDIATRDWTVGALAIFVWLTTSGVLIWMIKRKDAVIADLARQMAEQSKEQTEDLKQQREEGREDTRRTETASIAVADGMRMLGEKATEGNRRLEAIERKLELRD